MDARRIEREQDVSGATCASEGGFAFRTPEDAAATRTLERAVASARTENVLLPAALVYLRLRLEERALDLAGQLSQRLEPDSQAYAHLVRGEAERRRGRPRDAVRELARAHELADTWLGHVALGRAYLDLEAFPEAQTELETAVNRRGEATAAFLDEVPTYRLFPPVLYYLGRAGVALKDPAAAESLRAFLAIRGGARRDPLVVEARKLLALPAAPSTSGAPPASGEAR